MYSDITTT